MEIVMVSNYLNHHQYPLCQELMKRKDIEFHFIATKPVRKERLALGYKDMNQENFVIREYENQRQKAIAEDLCRKADVVITGSAPEIYSQIRIKSNKLLLRYSERIFRKSYFQRFSPNVIKNMFRYHIQPRGKKVFLLCSSAYTAEDFNKMGAYRNKTFKWGYFPKVKKYNDIESVIEKKEKNSILWVARFLDLKHPEYVVEVAKKLMISGYQFKVSMIGVGEKMQDIRRLIEEEGLQDIVGLKGAMSPEEVRENMEKSDLFLFTSDFREGWGAVLNEAMNSACAVVASHAIGSVPFLIQDKDNGMIYKNGDVEELCKNVRLLLDNQELKRTIQNRAYYSIVEQWNPEVAAKRLIELSEDLLNQKECVVFKEGPCSRAERIKNNWFKG